MSGGRHRRVFTFVTATVLLLGVLNAADPPGRSGRANITSTDLKEWLTYIASDELGGRAVFSPGIGLAAGYIADHLRAWKVKPAGDDGSYLQTVRVLGVRVTRRSSVTVEVSGQTRTFADGQGIRFPLNAGGKRNVTIDRIEFVGYGVDAPAARYSDFTGRDVRGAAVVWLGTSGPKAVDSAAYAGLLARRGRHAIDDLKAGASIGPDDGGGRTSGTPAASEASAGARGRGAAIPTPDFTTAQRLDAPITPNLSASDDFYEFLFSRAPVKYGELKRKAQAQEALPIFRLENVKLTFDIDADYQIVRTQLTQNVVGVIEGTDPQLKNTYVAFGAHYDHLGYAEGEIVEGRRTGAPGRVTDGAGADRIWNGADDNGSGTVAVMGIARAFAEGPRPRRSVLVVWHTGEERGLWGSRYFVDHPTVPLASVVAQLNIDMIGRNRDDKTSESNTVYLIGSDRISTELDAVSRAANADLTRPLTLNYEFNDPSDTEQLYTRSDHYSYATKGIPIIFFMTGLHPDYHTNTDHVSKIEFEKMTRITQLIYETGWRVANLDRAPVRDNRGPRAGRSQNQ